MNYFTIIGIMTTIAIGIIVIIGLYLWICEGIHKIISRNLIDHLSNLSNKDLELIIQKSEDILYERKDYNEEYEYDN